MPCLRRPIPAARRHTSRRASSPASRARRHRGAALRPRQAPIGRASSSPFPFPLVARLSAGLWVRVHDQHVLEVPQVHGGNEDRALEGPVLAFGDLNDLTEDQAFRIERFQVISDREPRGDDDVADLHVLGLKDPVHHERVAELAADDARRARALNERGHSRGGVGDEENLAVIVSDLAHTTDDSLIRDDDVVEEHAVLGACAEDDRVQETGRVPRDDRSALRLELERLGGFGKLRALQSLKGLLPELDVLERELVDPRLKGVVVGPEVLDLGDRLPEPAGGGADLAEDTFSRDQELRYEGGAGADEGRVTEEEQSKGDDEKPGEGPEEGVPRAWGAPRAPKSGHGPYLTRQTLVCL